MLYDTDNLVQTAHPHCDLSYALCRRQHIVGWLISISSVLSGDAGRGFGCYWGANVVFFDRMLR